MAAAINTILNHYFTAKYPSWFIPSIRKILAMDIPPPSKSPIIYEFNKRAIHHNSEILKKFDYNLDLLIDSYPSSDLSYGSEFRPVSILAPLLHYHHY